MTARERHQTLSDWVYMLLAALILGVPLCGWLTGVVSRGPASTPVPTPTRPAVGMAACASQPPYHTLSPNGRFCVIDDPYHHSVVIIAADGRGTSQEWAKWTRFDGWTADSAYALYSRTDQYGNSEGWAFSTDRWQATPVITSDGDCFSSMDGDCGRGIVAIAPRSPRVLLRDGRIVRLPEKLEADVLHALPEDTVLKAAWSPDETKLAFAAIMRHEGDAAVYLWEGNNEVKTLLSFPRPDSSDFRLTWGAGGTSLQLTGSVGQYDLLP